MENHIYLGDGVYAEVQSKEHRVILRTGSHKDEACSNIIYLEYDTIGKLLDWLAPEIRFRLEETIVN